VVKKKNRRGRKIYDVKKLSRKMLPESTVSPIKNVQADPS